MEQKIKLEKDLFCEKFNILDDEISKFAILEPCFKTYLNAIHLAFQIKPALHNPKVIK